MAHRSPCRYIQIRPGIFFYFIFYYFIFIFGINLFIKSRKIKRHPHLDTREEEMNYGFGRESGFINSQPTLAECLTSLPNPVGDAFQGSSIKSSTLLHPPPHHPPPPPPPPAREYPWMKEKKSIKRSQATSTTTASSSSTTISSSSPSAATDSSPLYFSPQGKTAK